MLIGNPITNDYACAFPCQIFDGTFEIDGAEYENTVPLPISDMKNFKLTLNVIDDDDEQRQIEISGTGIRLTLVGNAGRFELFPGADQS
jgi:carbon monoxide dehydrogenase subunit G